MTSLPDAEKLCAQLVRELAPRIGARTAMVGLYTGGVWLAERLHAELRIEKPLGAMDIAFYRDDYAARGLKHDPKRTRIPFDVKFDGKNVPRALDLMLHNDKNTPPFPFRPRAA